MRITAYTDYSLRVLIYLALRRDELSTIREIAGAYNISRNHLMKVVHQLQRQGYITTVRGKQGGMELSRPPAEINVGQVVRDMEPDLSLVECFDADGQCVITPHCFLKSVLARALQGFMAELDKYTLADLVNPAVPELRETLRIEVTPEA